MPYQSFSDEEPGDSDSLGKLNTLFFPSLEGLSILDIGCNEGYFCFELIRRGAARAVGMDINEQVIQKANNRADNSPFRNKISFLCGNWENLPDEKFDLVLLLSSLHYAKDQFNLIDNLMNCVKDNGILILECGVIEDLKYEFVKVDRVIDQRLYPTISLLKTHLNRYAYRFLRKSVKQVGDPVDRWVIHVKHKKGTCILISGPPMSGKTTLARTLGGKGMLVLSLDNMLAGFIENNPESWGDMDISKCRLMLIDYYDIVNKDEEVCNKFINSIINQFDLNNIPINSDTIIYIEGYGFNLNNIRNKVSEFLESRGFILWHLTRPLIEKGILENVTDLEFRGWAFSNHYLKPYVKIDVNNRYAGLTEPVIERGDVSSMNPDVPIKCGFSFKPPDDLTLKVGDKVSANIFYSGIDLNNSPSVINAINIKRYLINKIKNILKF